MRDINPATVELDGVHAIAHITRKVKRDEFPFATYVFVADQLNLPPGLTTATLTGQTKSGVTFDVAEGRAEHHPTRLGPSDA